MKVGDLVKHIYATGPAGYGIIIGINHEWGTPPTTALFELDGEQAAMESSPPGQPHPRSLLFYGVRLRTHAAIHRPRSEPASRMAIGHLPAL